jgi:CBS domain containing-hemolysin-like protein
MITPVLLLFFFGSVVFSMLSSLFEATLLSITPAYIGVLKERGSPTALILARLKERIDRPLIAILSLNTLANMFGAAGVGAEAARIAHARGIPEAGAVAVASGVLTFTILVFAEITPKTLGAMYWKPIAPYVAWPILVVMYILYPLVRVLELLLRIVSRGSNSASVSREEIGVLAETAGQLGTLKPHEKVVIANLLALSELRAESVLTPRLEMVTVGMDETAGGVAADKPRMRHSRIPVTGEDIDDIKGFVLRHDVLYACLHGKPDTKMADLVMPISVVPETATLDKLLERFSVQKDGVREQILLVVNEYGGTEGIITLEDIIESLLGIEILDETDLVADLRQLAERKAAVRKRRMNLGE